MQTALVAFLVARADLRADRCRPAIAAEQGRPLGRTPVVSLSRVQAGHKDLGARSHEMVIAVGHVGWVAPSQDPGTSWRTRSRRSRAWWTQRRARTRSKRACRSGPSVTFVVGVGGRPGATHEAHG